MVRALGWALILWLWSVCGVAVVAIIHEWWMERLSVEDRNLVAWLWVAGSVWRVR